MIKHPWIMGFCRFFRNQWKVAAFTMFVVGPIAWAYFDNKIPVDYLTYKVETPDVKPGGALVISYTVMRDRLCPAIISRLMIDNQGVVQEIAPVSFGRMYKPGDAIQAGDQNSSGTRKINQEETIKVRVPVPASMAPGTAKYQGVLVYYCSWVQERLSIGIQATTPIVTFNVLPEPEKNIFKEMYELPDPAEAFKNKITKPKLSNSPFN